MPEMTDRTGDYANECAKDYLQVGTNEGKKIKWTSIYSVNIFYYFLIYLKVIIFKQTFLRNCGKNYLHEI